jgi:hypothetical protein
VLPVAEARSICISNLGDTKHGEDKTVTEDILADLWKIEDLSACKEGVALAHDFLGSCMSALHSGHSSNFNARFENFNRHRDTCETCSGLKAVA